MSLILLGIFLISAFTIVMFSTTGVANSLDTSSDVNKMGALQVFDSSGSTLLGLNLGTSDDITSVTLTFHSNITALSNVEISFKDDDDMEIGNGSTLVPTPLSVIVINLDDEVTDIERNSLQTAYISVT